jgi:hypothetical protein
MKVILICSTPLYHRAYRIAAITTPMSNGGRSRGLHTYIELIIHCYTFTHAHARMYCHPQCIVVIRHSFAAIIAPYILMLYACRSMRDVLREND